MPSPYERADSDGFRVVDEWDSGVGWQAHPEETGERTSHAVATEDGVWLFDPLDAPGIDERIADLGEVTGVLVCSDYHARDAAVFARRHGVPVTVPAWLSRIEARVDAPTERVRWSVAGFQLRRLRPLWAWRETVAYRERDGTLYVPDFLSTHAKFTAGTERLGMPTFSRLRPPRETLDCDPERILLGHGEGVFDDAAGVLESTLAGARDRFPQALVRNLPGEIRAMAGALRD
jgi:hypothetical protein